jgi:hypothetical protein
MAPETNEIRTKLVERLGEIEGKPDEKEKILAILDKLLASDVGARLLNTFVGNG